MVAMAAISHQRFVRLPGNPASRRSGEPGIGTAATQPRRTRFRSGGSFPAADASASFEIPATAVTVDCG